MNTIINVMHHFRKFSRYGLILLFPLVCWLFINNTANRHSHQLKAGNIITHAHPYERNHTNKSPLQSHHHSDHEFFILDLISNIIVIISIPLFISYFQKLLVEIKIQHNGILPYLYNFNLQKYRAPPATH